MRAPALVAVVSLICSQVHITSEEQARFRELYVPAREELAQDGMQELLERWDAHVKAPDLASRAGLLKEVSRYVHRSARLESEFVARYSNPEIDLRITALYLAEYGGQPYGGQPLDGLKPIIRAEHEDAETHYDYDHLLMTVAESTFAPGIYDVVLRPPDYVGALRLPYLASVSPDRTLRTLEEATLGESLGKPMNGDCFYRSEDGAPLLRVNEAFELLGLMTEACPEVLLKERKSVLAFLAAHAKHYLEPQKITAGGKAVYRKGYDNDVRHYALDVLGSVGCAEDVCLAEEIMAGSPILEGASLTRRPERLREPVAERGTRVIADIRQREPDALAPRQ